MSVDCYFCSLENFHNIFTALQKEGVKIIGPTVRYNNIIYDQITSAEELPIGVTFSDVPDRPIAERREDEAYFGYGIPVQPFTRFLFRSKEDESDDCVYRVDEPNEVRVFLGVRPCELSAIHKLQELSRQSIEKRGALVPYCQRTVFLVCYCTTYGASCFCNASAIRSDLEECVAATFIEVLTPHHHFFLFKAEKGSPKSEWLEDSLHFRKASQREIELADMQIAKMKQEAGQKHCEQNLAAVWEASDDKGNPSFHKGCCNCLYGKRGQFFQWEENKVLQRCVSCFHCEVIEKGGQEKVVKKKKPTSPKQKLESLLSWKQNTQEQVKKKKPTFSDITELHDLFERQSRLLFGSDDALRTCLASGTVAAPPQLSIQDQKTKRKLVDTLVERVFVNLSELFSKEAEYCANCFNPSGENVLFWPVECRYIGLRKDMFLIEHTKRDLNRELRFLPAAQKRCFDLLKKRISEWSQIEKDRESKKKFLTAVSLITHIEFGEDYRYNEYCDLSYSQLVQFRIFRVVQTLFKKHPKLVALF